MTTATTKTRQLDTWNILTYKESKLYKAFQEAFAISKNLNEKQKKKLYALRFNSFEVIEDYIKQNFNANSYVIADITKYGMNIAVDLSCNYGTQIEDHSDLEHIEEYTQMLYYSLFPFLPYEGFIDG